MSTNSDRRYLGREAILAYGDRPTQAVQVPEWGDAWVRLATWSLATQWRIAQASTDLAQRGQLLALVAALSLVDEAGALLFTEADVAVLTREKNYRALQRIAHAAMAWNGLTADSVDALGKASEPPPSDASPSASPVLSG
jgi:hypothetical protein